MPSFKVLHSIFSNYVEIEIAAYSMEKTVEMLRPQGVSDAFVISITDGDGKRCTNTVILTFASPQPPTHIKADHLRVPVEFYIPNPLY